MTHPIPNFPVEIDSVVATRHDFADWGRGHIDEYDIEGCRVMVTTGPDGATRLNARLNIPLLPDGDPGWAEYKTHVEQTADDFERLLDIYRAACARHGFKAAPTTTCRAFLRRTKGWCVLWDHGRA